MTKRRDVGVGGGGMQEKKNDKNCHFLSPNLSHVTQESCCEFPTSHF